MKSIKWQKEVKKKEQELKEVNAEIADLNERKATGDPLFYKMIQRERRRLRTKQDHIQTKINVLNKTFVSTSEMTAVKKESSYFVTVTRDKSLGITSIETVTRDKSLGITSIEKVGFSPTLRHYVHVDITHYSGFLANVKGCASLANKTELNSAVEISEAEYHELRTKPGVATTSFLGATQTNAINR